MSHMQPTPREPEKLPKTPIVVLVCMFLVLAVAAFAYQTARIHSEKTNSKPCAVAIDNEGDDAEHSGHTPTMDALTVTYTNKGEKVFWYVFVDPEYGTQWVYNDHDWRAFPRMDGDGRQIGSGSNSLQTELI